MDRAVAAIILVAAWVATWRPATDPDQWWHLVFGRSIVRDSVFPRVETLSWWTAGDPVVAHSWLWDVVLYATQSLGGPTGMSLLGAAVSGIAMALLWALVRATVRSVGPMGRATIVLVAVLAPLPLWGARAQAIDLVAIAALALFWTVWLRGGSDRVLLAVPVVTLLWANLHGSAVLAYGLCVAALVVAIPVGLRWGTWTTRPWRPLAVAVVVGAVALALNPNGPWLLGYPFDPAVASAGNPAIDEWRPPAFGDGALLVLRAVVAGAALAALARPADRRDPLLLVLAAGFTFLALGSVRFALIGGPLLVVALGPGVIDAIRRRIPERRESAVVGTPARLVIGGSVGVVAAILLAIGWTYLELGAQQRAQAGRLPVTMQDRMPEACDGRLFNAYDWGGYLAWASERDVGAYGNSPGFVVDEQAALENLTADPASFLDANGIQVALVKAGSPLARWFALAPGWVAAGSDDVATAFARDEATACQRW